MGLFVAEFDLTNCRQPSLFHEFEYQYQWC